MTEHQIDKNTKLIRYFPYTEKPSGIKKLVAYLKWFNACYHLLKEIKDEYEIDADIKELEYIKSKYELLSYLESKQLLTKDAKEHYAAILKKRLVKT